MPFEIAGRIEFNGYRESGGKLSQEVYIDATVALEEQNVKSREFCKATKAQAACFAGRLGFDLTPKQTFLYCFLREDEHLCLCDQGLFAEALLMTNDFKKYSEFTSAYPNIFRH